MSKTSLSGVSERTPKEYHKVTRARDKPELEDIFISTITAATLTKKQVALDRNPSDPSFSPTRTMHGQHGKEQRRCLSRAGGFEFNGHRFSTVSWLHL